MPVIHAEDLTVIKENTVDLLGINYYQPRRVKAKTPIDTKTVQCLRIISTIMKCLVVK